MHIKEIALLPENLKNEYQDLSSSHNYRTEIPNIIFHMNLTPWEFKAYCVIKKTAGDKGVCFKSNSTLSEEIGCSVKFTIDLKKDLERLNLIKITKRKNEKGGDLPDLIQVKDIWPQNMEYMSKLFPKNPDNDVFKIIDMGVNHGKGEGVHRSHKEDPIQEDPKEEYIALSLSSCEEPKKERKEALKMEIEFRNGRFQNISIEQIDSWKRAYPGENIEAYIAQFESVLNLNPRRIASKTPWSARLNSWIRTQSKEKDRMKIEIVQNKEPIKEEKTKNEPTPYAEKNFWYSQSAKDLVSEWSEKLGSKGILSFLSNILSLKIFSTNESWNIPIDDKNIVKFLEFIPKKIKKEIEIPQT